MPRSSQSAERWSAIQHNLDDVVNKDMRDKMADQAIEKLKLTPEQQTAIKLYSQRAGDQIGRLFASLIEDGLTIILSGKQPTSSFSSSKIADSQDQSGQTYKLLNASEVGKALGVSKSKAYSMMRQKQIPCIRIDSSVRVRPEDLEEFIKNNLM